MQNNIRLFNKSIKINDTSYKRIKITLALVTLCLLTLIIYWPATKHEFQKQWDDPLQVADNMDIRDFSLDGIIKIFSSTYVGMYQPVPTLSYMVEYFFSGDGPSVYHTTNIFIHIINILLVFWLIMLLSERNKIAAFTASALFALHPVNVETVAWVSTRSNLIFALFFLLTLISYLYYIKRGLKRKLFFLSLLFFLLALFSKSQAIVIPLVIVLLDHYNNRHNKKQVCEKLPFFALSVIFGVITYYTRKVVSGEPALNFEVITDRVLYICYAVVWYLYKLILPVHLSADYYYPLKNNSFLPVVFYITFFICIAILIIVFKLRKHNVKFVYAFMFFLAAVSVTLPVFSLGSFIVADRYAYVPFIGFFWFFGELSYTIYLKIKSKYSFKIVFVSMSLFLIILATFSCLSYRRNLVWRSGETLFKDVLYKNPWSYMAWYALGNIYQENKKHKEAVYLFQQAININDADGDIFLNQGAAYLGLNNIWRAMWNYNKSLIISGNKSLPHINKGLLNIRLSKNREAVSEFEQALKIDSNSYQAWAAKGVALMGLKAWKSANVCFNNNIVNRAVKYGLLNNNIYINRGICYYSYHMYDKALYNFKYILFNDPYNEELWFTLGSVFLEKGLLNKAIDCFTKTISIRDNNSEAYIFRGVAHLKKGNNFQALYNFNKGLNLDYLSGNAYMNRALVFVNLKRFKEALPDFNRSVVLNPYNSYAYFNRGLFHMYKNNMKSALADFSQSILLNDTLPESFFRRAIVYEQMKLYSKAEEDYTSAISLSGDTNVSYYAARGNLRIKMNKVEEGMADFNVASISVNRDVTTSIYNDRGVALMKQYSFLKAIKEFNSAILINPEYANAYANRGVCRFKLNDMENALSDLNISIKSGIVNKEVFICRGKIYVNKGMYDKANMDFTRAAELDRKDPEIYHERGVAKFKAGNNLGAVDDITTAIKLDSMNAVYYLNRANAYAGLLQTGNAISDYETAITIKPDYADAWFNLGLLKLKKNEPVLAITYFTKVIEINPSDHEAFFNRGLARLMTGNKEDACSDWLTAANLGNRKTNILVLDNCLNFLEINK